MTPVHMIDNFEELQITYFETGETLNSPFVRGAKMQNSRALPRLNLPFNVPGPKRGTSGTFGKKRGFGAMVM